ncbi:helix-turn-helix domain-containing protein [Mesorhizobium sp. ANAO-SY3R2]|uniref:helix-turn-helix domain-containing protein n=1 Tax=Mesorhizobium sp. ANAO-SY3R2 TaxID=3166644 RepID=UPI00366FC02C
MQQQYGSKTASVNGLDTANCQKMMRLEYRPMEKPHLAQTKATLERIHQRLEAVGMSAQGASKAAGLSPDGIRNIERNVARGLDHGIKVTTLSKLAPVLQTTVAWLTEGAGPETPPRSIDAKLELLPQEDADELFEAFEIMVNKRLERRSSGGE